MHRRSGRGSALTAGVAGLALAATYAGPGAGTAVAAVPGAAASVAAAPAAGTPAAATPAVTLITGDRVRLVQTPGGEAAVGIEPAPGREHVGFLRDTRSGRNGTAVTVVPSDALKLLAAGRLDPRLFDITELVRSGYADAAARPGLPLIVTYADRAAAARARVPAPAAATVRSLPSVNAAAVRQDPRRRGEFWRWLTGTGSTRGHGADKLAAGVAMVWLDGLARPTLDASLPQIGAPAAWQAGFTGAGVTVGVLDTGVKADHPDLTGKVVEAKDFTGTNPDAGDDAGHGTHVAGIIAGTGAASGGRYKGVAPDAKLVSGKVCATWGCPESAIIAGMEWIAPKARVVNMSLGGWSTDGTDPTSQALNNLTAKHGTLFVVAAGNAGTADQVSAPAAADAALAVGSVTKQDATSAFSSRGPRAGDYAVKPDIGAPGSDIVAARAPGTPGGDADPVGDHYVRHSGTSMAAPHVAGAAAVVAQQHAEWSAAQLKPALMSTAKPTAGVFDQGAGRLDAGRAVTQRVSSTSGSVSYGYIAWPRKPQPISRPVTYRNDGDAAVTLALSVAVTGPGGKPAPAGLITTSAGHVTVPAHGTAAVDVTVHPGAADTGLYGGRLTAAAAGDGGGIAIQTALGAYFEPESYDLTVRLVSRTGTFDEGSVQVVETTTGEAYSIRAFDAAGVGKIRLPKGRYDVNGFDVSLDKANAEQPYTLTLLSRPGVAHDSDTVVTLDATDGKPLGAVVDKPDAKRQFGELGVLSANPAGDAGGSVGWFTRPRFQLFAVPTGAKVTDHTYAFFFRVTLATARPGTDPAGYVYHLAFLERSRIPVDTTFESPDRQLATVQADYHTQGAASDAIRADYARLAVPGTGGGTFEVYSHTLPSKRTEYYSAHPDVLWLHILQVSTPESSGVELNRSTRTYRPGRYLAGWNRAPLGPAFGQPVNGWRVARAGKQLQAAVTLLSCSDPAQFTAPASEGMTGTTTLSRDGVVLGSSDQPGIGEFPMPDTPGRYTLRATAARAVLWSVIGTRADVAWTFRDPGAAAPAKPLPLFVVRATGAVDEAGRAPAGRAYALRLTVQRQAGVPAVPLNRLRVEASFDDGATWTAAPAVIRPDGGYAVIRHASTALFVSLRITARDAAGNTVRQTVIRAYQTAAVPR